MIKDFKDHRIDSSELTKEEKSKNKKRDRER